jgi:hypothetical protein
VNLDPSILAVDDKVPDNVAAVQPSREEVKSWEKSFAMNVGLSIIQRALPFRIPGFGF